VVMKEEKLAVLHIIDHIGIGGAQRLLFGILRRRKKAWVLPLRHREHSLLNLENDQVIRPLWCSFWDMPRSIVELVSLIRKEHIDIIHCHLQWGWIAGLLLSIFFIGRKGPRFVFHEHNSEIVHLVWYSVLVKMVSRFGIIIAVSDWLKETIEQLGVTGDKIVRIHNGIDLEEFTSEERKKRIAEGEFVVGFVGRLTANKGWRDYLQVVEALRSEKIKFLIAGAGAARDEMERIIRERKLKEKVEYLGYVSDMERFYSQIDLFLLPSRLEAMGLSPLEAQACGVPVVAYDIQAMRETLLESSAVLVKVGDIEALSRAVQKIYSDPDIWKKLVALGYKNVEQYSFDNFMCTLDGVYEKITLENQK
jgi:glycosyltransferase involved in cell wall biosynthesis